MSLEPDPIAGEGRIVGRAEGCVALVIAHPGHELRVHHWVERVRPVVCVLTDGSGSNRHSRLESTERVLDRAGAEPGPIFGRLSDRAIYRALTDGDTGRFVDLAREIEALIVERGIRVVAGDALEGYNPAHDVCRMIIDAVCRRVAGRAVENLEFSLFGHPGEGPPPRSGSERRLRLDDAALGRKFEAAEGYVELQDEVAASLEAFGRESFRAEVLLPATRSEPTEVPPFYESFGELRVRSGAYAEVLRYQEHVVPVQRALDAYVLGVD